MRKIGKVVVVAGLVACGLIGAQPANAAANPYSPEGVCGDGYTRVDSHPLKSLGQTHANIYLLYNSASGYNCVVTLRTETTGTRWLAASLAIKDGGSDSDRGEYKHYAGPVRLYAKGKCVKWGGAFDTDPGISYSSPWEHCG
ncbi:hypothetical protein [Nonomuraea sp. NPDC049695]|uniref:hypothetical protein n=1 Tax=Nonomuraea sp. NPDC049695 TaxID=3154734 RepID=UPI0034241F1E